MSKGKRFQSLRFFPQVTDFREACLQDVINKLEPGLFVKVTGLKITDFELLVSLSVFDQKLMNETIYMFRRYEDSSLTYTGIDKLFSRADSDDCPGSFRLHLEQLDGCTAPAMPPAEKHPA